MSSPSTGSVIMHPRTSYVQGKKGREKMPTVTPFSDRISQTYSPFQVNGSTGFNVYVLSRLTNPKASIVENSFPVNMEIQAGRVVGGIVDSNVPYTPFFMRVLRCGRSAFHFSRKCGLNPSSPSTMSFIVIVILSVLI